MRGLGQDLRFALRGLRRNLGFTAVVVAVLALGIGANSAIFSVVNAVLLRPLPYHQPDRLVTALHGGRHPVAPANFLDWRAQNHVFSGMAAAQMGGATLHAPGQPPEAAGVMQVTADLFPVLGVPPLLGRVFSPDEDGAGAGPVAVLSHKLWQRRFAGDPTLVGRSITLDGKAHTVVGIMPPSFQFAPFWFTGAELWVPLDLTTRTNDREGASLRVFARLAPGITHAAAQTEMSAIWRRLMQQFPGSQEPEVTIDSLHEKAVGKIRPALLVLLGAVGLVLLIACANVANLLLSRSAARRSELAVRAALGAGRARLVRQLLTESLLLGGLGCALALGLAHWGIDLLLAFGPANLPRIETIGLDAKVLAFTVALALATSLLFGLAPALQASHQNLSQGLRGGSRAVAGGGQRGWLRATLVIAEVALAVMLLIGAGLLLRSFQRLAAVDLGFDPRQVLTMGISTSGPGHQGTSHRQSQFQRLLGRIRALPGVQSASAINHLPINGDLWGTTFTVVGRPVPPPEHEPRVTYRKIGPGYMATMGMALLRGREFTDHDTSGAEPVVIINETFAREIWPGDDAIGKHIRWGDAPYQVIGVIKDAKLRDLAVAPGREMYLPYLQHPTGRTLTLVARVSGDPVQISQFSALVQNEIWAVDPSQPASQPRAMEDVVARALGQPRFNALLLNLFAALALLLAAVGIYAVMAHAVGQRTREIGIRMALGARSPEVLTLVLGHGIRLTGIGVALGLAGAFATSHLLSTLLFGVTATDPLIFALIPAILVAVGLLACYLPARRATRIDPMVALRAE